LALQRVEAQSSLVLSRQIGTPNIASKGKLSPRIVSIPSFLAGDSATNQTTAASVLRPLIQEVGLEATSPISSKGQPFDKKIKGILKSNLSHHRSTTSIHKANSSKHTRPAWSWSREEDRLVIVISVPSLVGRLFTKEVPAATLNCQVPSAIAQATLDIEPRRFVLNIPDFPVLDVDLNVSDAEIVSLASSATSVSLHGASGDTGMESSNTLTLKRQRDLNVDEASAEWNTAENVLVLTA
jgi:hypothetical protein